MLILPLLERSREYLAKLPSKYDAKKYDAKKRIGEEYLHLLVSISASSSLKKVSESSPSLRKLVDRVQNFVEKRLIESLEKRMSLIPVTRGKIGEQSSDLLDIQVEPKKSPYGDVTIGTYSPAETA